MQNVRIFDRYIFHVFHYLEVKMLENNFSRQLLTMALRITSQRFAITLRNNCTYLLIAHVKNEAEFVSYKRSYHMCHKLKHMVFKNGCDASFILPRSRQVDALAGPVNRYASTDVNSSVVNEISQKISTNAAHLSPLDSLSVSALSETQKPIVNAPSTEHTLDSSKVAETSIDFIPEPPVLPAPDKVIPLQEISGEPSFESLGLGGWTPVGVIQNILEFLHVDFSLPWWSTIALGTICVRILIFPLVVVAQRNAAKMNNYLPQLQMLQMKMTEARQTGNQLEAARYAQEMVTFMKEKDLNPLKNMLVPLAQAPLFISFFLSLRKMAACPVESMKEGGLFWFTDLTMPDQYFLLPILTSVTMWVTIEVGTDSAKLSASNMQLMKYFLRAMPVIILPFTINFPGAILCYWVCSNFISLGQVAILRIPSVREYFKIEKLVNHNQDSLPMKPKGFTKGFKDSWENMKITKELEERQRFDEMQFLKAGRGPIQKTYKHDPTREDKGASLDKSNKSKPLQ